MQNASSGTERPGPALARHMGLAALIVYGVGDMLGAGIYGLIGNWAGIMGNAIWLAFLASLVAALTTGLSYASLGSRYPRAAGAAYITHRAFGLSILSYVVGLAVVASGLTSMATQSRAFTGYLLGFLSAAPPGAAAGAGVWFACILGFVGVLSLVNFWGIRESTRLNALCTAIEVSGLFLVIAVGLAFWGSVDYLETPARSSDVSASLSIGLVLQGAVLTFYSFLGFEDMINVTEEVKDPRRSFPIAVIAALAVTASVYVAVAVTAVSVVPYAELAASSQPLVDVVARAAPWFPSGLFSIVALFAITNTALLNYVMGSRVVYGMARQGLLPAVFGRVHPTRRTPHLAIGLLMTIVLLLALPGDIRILASATSVLLLSVFVVVNASLIVLQRRAGEPPGVFEVPSFVPACGIVVSGAMLWNADPAAWRVAALLLAGILVFYALERPAAVVEEPGASE